MGEIPKPVEKAKEVFNIMVVCFVFHDLPILSANLSSK